MKVISKLLVCLGFSMILVAASCDGEGPVEESTQDAVDETGDALDETGDAIGDGVDDMQDAADEAGDEL